MARYRRKKSHGHKSRKIPLLATVGVAAYGANIYNGYKAGQLPGATFAALGVNASGQFSMAQFGKSIAPVAVGVIGSMIASKTGVNRYLAKVPLFKL
jgi:hypothetical protein